METETTNKVTISADDFKLIKSFLPSFSRAAGIRTNDYVIDWNSIMPVVEKIDSLGYHVTIMKTRTTIAITLNVQNHIQSIHPGYSMIEVTYQAVLEFIKWYNNQKEKATS